MTICKRLSDGTYWTPAGDIPFPLNGFNFVRAVRKSFWIFSWWTKEKHGERWVFTDGRLFDVVKKK